MKNHYLLVLIMLSAVLVISVACDNSSEASNAPQSDNNHSTQNTSDNQSNADSNNTSANTDNSDTQANNANNNEPNVGNSDEKSNQEKEDTPPNNTEEKKKEYLKKLDETEKEMEQRENDLDSTSTYALKEVQVNRFDAWDDLLNDIYSVLNKQLPAEDLKQYKNSVNGFLIETLKQKRPL